MLSVVPIDAPPGDRYMLVRTPTGAPIDRIALWWHGGGQGPGGSYRMAKRIPETPGRLDVFGEGFPHPDREGNLTTGWQRPDFPPAAGFDGHEDVDYTGEVLEVLRTTPSYAGLPWAAVGYSSGGAFWCSLAVESGHIFEVLAGFRGFGVVKNSLWIGMTGHPTPSWVDGGRFVGRTFDRHAFWYAEDDQAASDDPADGHATWADCVGTWNRTYPGALELTDRYDRPGARAGQVEVRANAAGLLVATELPDRELDDHAFYGRIAHTLDRHLFGGSS